MNDEDGNMTGRIHHHGHPVPIVAFYSVQGGVGKTTLARKFAELVTVAPGRDSRKPNVLIIDLDVEAQGLTYRLTQGIRQNIRTVHEVLAHRNAAFAQAVTATMWVSLSSGNLQGRGQLYLMPAAPPEAKGLFDTISTIDRQDLFKLLEEMIQGLVIQYDVSCVVIDCAPGANPYTAAAATLSDVPLLIGRNEQATYDQIRVLPERFREFYPVFQPAKQSVIINAVSYRESYEAKARQYSVLDYIPLTTDVILETEGLMRVGSFRMMLFEKYIVDIIKKVFVGMNHLIPETPEVVGQEWVDALNRLQRYQEAPRMKRLMFFSYLRWIGLAIFVIGVALWGTNRVFAMFPETATTWGILSIIAGLLLGGGGWYVESERHRLLSAIRDMLHSGPDRIFEMLKAKTHRGLLEDLRRLADSIPSAQKPPKGAYSSKNT